MRSGWSRIATLGCFAVTGAVALAVAGCDARQDEGTAVSTSSDAVPATATVTQDQTVVFPAAYFDAVDAEDPAAYLAEAGYADVTEAEDGSYTATVPAARYDALITDVHDLARSIINALPDDEDYPDVVAVDYDDQFATVTVTFDTDALSAQDALVAYVPGETAVMYQQITGLPIGCDVILVGSDGSELSSTMFPVKEASSSEGTSTAA